jgi:hypothetical protein
MEETEPKKMPCLLLKDFLEVKAITYSNVYDFLRYHLQYTWIIHLWKSEN